MSTILYENTLSNCSNCHDSQTDYQFDHYHNITFENNNNNLSETRIKTNQNISLDDTNDDEHHCQICGDVASGWHSG